MKTTLMRRTVPRTLGAGVLAALTLHTLTAFGQLAITNITIPGAASLAVSSLNATGAVAGYYMTDSGAQRAFVWSKDASSDLGTLGGSVAVANALNNSGHVVGYSSLPGDMEFRAFLHGPALIDLGNLGGPISSALALNDAGHVTGYSYVSPLSIAYSAFLWNGTTLQNLGSLGGSFCSGTAINTSGHVAGDSTLPGDWENHAFLYRDGAMRDLGTLGGSVSYAFGLNELGHVTGQSTTFADLETRAFLYDGIALRNVGTLGGSFSAGYALNDLGQVIGDSYTANDAETHGFLYENNAIRDLGTLGGGYSSAWAINNLGQIVGVSSNSVGLQRAFLWQNGAMTDLNDLLPSNSEWELSAAYFINDAGYIVGDGLYRGQYHWYQLSPATHVNRSPVAEAGNDVIAECIGGSAAIGLNGTGSSDPDNDALTYEWSEAGIVVGTGATLNVNLASGIHMMTLRVTDTHGAFSEDALVVSVLDTSAPMIVCVGNQSAFADASGMAIVPDVVSSSIATDSCTSSLSLVKSQTPSAGTLVGLGVHTITVTVEDTAGLKASCTTTFTVTDITPPTIECPAAVTSSANESGVSQVPNFLGALIASDNCTAASALAKTQSPASGTTLGVGTHTVLITVTDAAGNHATCTTTLTVVDVTSPSVEAPAELIRPVDANCRAAVPDLRTEISAHDNCTPSHQLIFAQQPAAGSFLNQGTHQITVTVSDASGNVTTRMVTFRAVDLTAPLILPASASPNELSPANRKMISVTVSVAAQDNCDASPVCRIVSVTSNEPDAAAASTSPDWVIKGNLTVDLRAEVVSSTQPRLYTILLSCTDASGNVSYETVTVKVPVKGGRKDTVTTTSKPGNKK